MTIQEAIKSGKPFKRKNHRRWITVKQLHPEDDAEFRLLDSDLDVYILPCAVLADDWEIDESFQLGSEGERSDSMDS